MEKSISTQPKKYQPSGQDNAQAVFFSPYSTGEKRTEEKQKQTPQNAIAIPKSATSKSNKIAHHTKAIFLPPLALKPSLKPYQGQFTPQTTTTTENDSTESDSTESDSTVARPPKSDPLKTKSLKTKSLKAKSLKTELTEPELFRSPDDKIEPKAPLLAETRLTETRRIATYSSNNAKTRVKANPHAGHDEASHVFPGGSGQAIVGHGKRYKNALRATVPQGMSLLLLEDALSLSDVSGRVLESLNLENFVNANQAARDRFIEQQLDHMDIVDATMRQRVLLELESVQVLSPGARLDDYRIEPPTDLSIFESSISVAESTRLSDILEEGSGYWALATGIESVNEPEPP